MKTLYSSTFLSLIIAFLVFLGMNEEPINLAVDPVIKPSFSTIISPLPTILPAFEAEAYANPTKVTVEVFNTFGCNDCASFAINTLIPLREKYKDNENVEIKYYIVPNLESEGEKYSAIGVRCAEEQDKYWALFQELHLETEVLSSREVDLNFQEVPEIELISFRNCLKSDKYIEAIQADINYAGEKGITKKPTTIIGDYVLLGNQPIENIEKIINEIL